MQMHSWADRLAGNYILRYQPTVIENVYSQRTAENATKINAHPQSRHSTDGSFNSSPWTSFTHEYLHGGDSQHCYQHNLNYSHENQGFVRYPDHLHKTRHRAKIQTMYKIIEPNNLDHVPDNPEYSHQNADLSIQNIQSVSQKHPTVQQFCLIITRALTKHYTTLQTGHFSLVQFGKIQKC